jgi:3-hydroxyisobutyrate dehydrogenase-like beta-hydroxyacid dehydrogenase
MRIAFIGLGEAASAFITGWRGGPTGRIRAYDIKSAAAATAPEIAARAEHLGITACATAAEALDGAELVFSTVTADQAVGAAESYAGLVPKDALWCDLNSCAPQSKVKAAGIVAAAGGRYLDVAVMAPVHPALNKVPCLISGPEAAAAEAVLAALPMTVRVVGAEVGLASSIKMVRSIMVKGLEALTAECTLAAIAAGVEEEVFPSLKDGHPRLDVAERATYNFERSLVHGQRRAAEMDEVALMLADLGLPNNMAAATAHWQRVLSSTDLTLPEGKTPDHRWYAAAYLQRLGGGRS